ncbi:MAG: hypothetical protein GX074_02020 [Erysipelothrix sp.]|nr:hypothetical protein [Erysipelothrix sp.]
MKKSINLIILGIVLTMLDLFIGPFDLFPSVLAYFFIFLGVYKLRTISSDDTFDRIHVYSRNMMLYGLLTDLWNIFTAASPKQSLLFIFQF